MSVEKSTVALNILARKLSEDLSSVTLNKPSEAPVDGKQYARKDGAWVEVVAGGSFSGTLDDITDGLTYVKTENNYTDEEKEKLGNLSESGGLTKAQALGVSLL